LANYIRLKFWRGYWRSLLYRRHPNKVVRDSYTSHLQKIQVAGAVFAPLWLALAYWAAGWVGMLAGVALITLTALPSALYMARSHGLRIAAVATPMQFVASLSLSLGLVIGCLGELVGLRRPSKGVGRKST
jgi:hypothetical protein